MYFLLTFLAILPLRILQLFGYIIAWFLYRTNSSIHRITQINIQLAYPELNDKQKKDFLIEKYIEDKLSFNDIAVLCNTYANKIRRDIIKLKIPIRNKSEAQKNALTTGKHQHPTKGQKRKDETKQKIGKSVMKAWDRLSDAELDQRKENSKNRWDSLDDDTKKNILKLANQAARLSSKTGSKLEKYLLDKLLSDGFVVEFHKEQVLSNTKLQIDLFLPMMNVAIEVDGPSHFSPIWGKDALDKNIKYDEKKNGLILGKGTTLIRIKQTKDFSKSRSDLIYDKLLTSLNKLKNNKSTNTGDIIEIQD